MLRLVLVIYMYILFARHHLDTPCSSEHVVWQHVCRRAKRVQGTELDIVNVSLCNLFVLALKLLKLAHLNVLLRAEKSQKGQNTEQSTAPTLLYLVSVMLASRKVNFFQVV